MKIAAVTDDGVTISRHFGRSRFYTVVTVEDGKVTAREQREKLGHAHFSQEDHGEPGSGHAAHGSGRAGHGFDAASRERHARMASAITDCEVLISRGMGAGALENLKEAGIRPILTDISTIDEAVSAYLDGTIVDHPEMLH